MGEFLKKAFADMKESAKAQHKVDKAKMQAPRGEQIAQTSKRKEKADARINAAKNQ